MILYNGLFTSSHACALEAPTQVIISQPAYLIRTAKPTVIICEDGFFMVQEFIQWLKFMLINTSLSSHNIIKESCHMTPGALFFLHWCSDREGDSHGLY